ncbi:MAG: hypothetical protein LBN29_12010 [Mediterranea sp.]|nr:hypothetical protein [Mediterranea sp.]
MKLNEVVEIELMAINAELNPSVFKWAHSTFISPQLDERECEGFEIFVRGKTFYIPFQEVGGAACFLITVTKDKVEISISGMTKDILMLDYYRAEMEIGQHISVAYTHLKKITEPSRKRRYLEEP